MNEQELAQFQAFQSQAAAKLAQSEYNNARLQQSATMFSEDSQENIVKWQLDINEVLKRAERFLRGQVPKIIRTEKGEELIYVEDPEVKIFNERGITRLMQLLSIFVSKEIILSNYKEEQINTMMINFANRLIDEIYMNAEEFGLDNMQKMKYIPMTIFAVVSIVDATYRRAKDGQEQLNLRTRAIVNQSEQLGNQMYKFPQIKQKFKIYDPRTWKA